MTQPPRPTPPFDTSVEKRVERLEYLIYRICETLKINYGLDE